MAATAKQIFVNLPVKDLKVSVDFFTAIGFEFNPHFTDENATCLVISDTIYAMLLVEPYFRDFTKKEIPDLSRSAAAIVALSLENRELVDELADKALAAGGKQTNEPVDHGFMYTRSFQDPDGHLWELFHMDESAVPPQE